MLSQRCVSILFFWEIYRPQFLLQKSQGTQTSHLLQSKKTLLISLHIAFYITQRFEKKKPNT